MRETITMSYFDIPRTWDVGSSYPLSWITIEDGKKLRNQLLQTTKISEDVMVLVSRMPLMSEDAIVSVLKTQTTEPAKPEPEPEAKPLPEPAPEPAPKAEPAPKPEPAPKKAAKPKRKPKPKSKPHKAP